VTSSRATPKTWTVAPLRQALTLRASTHRPVLRICLANVSSGPSKPADVRPAGPTPSMRSRSRPLTLGRVARSRTTHCGSSNRTVWCTAGAKCNAACSSFRITAWTTLPPRKAPVMTVLKLGVPDRQGSACVEAGIGGTWLWRRPPVLQ
jgi:hypothetical protein